jgi:hypothetical protein
LFDFYRIKSGNITIILTDSLPKSPNIRHVVTVMTTPVSSQLE